jgi:hypothetical protein
MPRQILVREHKTAIVMGFGFFILGAVCLHDAYDGRGKQQPWWLRPFSFW